MRLIDEGSVRCSITLHSSFPVYRKIRFWSCMGNRRNFGRLNDAAMIGLYLFRVRAILPLGSVIADVLMWQFKRFFSCSQCHCLAAMATRAWRNEPLISRITYLITTSFAAVLTTRHARSSQHNAANDELYRKVHESQTNARQTYVNMSNREGIWTRGVYCTVCVVVCRLLLMVCLN